MSLREFFAPHTGDHTASGLKRRRVQGPREERSSRPRRTCEGPCPCHTDQTTQRSTR